MWLDTLLNQDLVRVSRIPREVRTFLFGPLYGSSSTTHVGHRRCLAVVIGNDGVDSFLNPVPLFLWLLLSFGVRGFLGSGIPAPAPSDVAVGLLLAQLGNFGL